MSTIFKMMPSNAKVLRGGEMVSVPTSQLVVGDIVDINIGDKVPADIRLLEVDQMKVYYYTLFSFWNDHLKWNRLTSLCWLEKVTQWHVQPNSLIEITLRHPILSSLEAISWKEVAVVSLLLLETVLPWERLPLLLLLTKYAFYIITINVMFLSFALGNISTAKANRLLRGHHCCVVVDYWCSLYHCMGSMVGEGLSRFHECCYDHHYCCIFHLLFFYFCYYLFISLTCLVICHCRLRSWRTSRVCDLDPHHRCQAHVPKQCMFETRHLKLWS